MSDAALQVTVGADVSKAVAGLQSFEAELKSAQTELNLIGRAIDIAISKGQDISALENSFQKVNTRIKELQASASSLPSSGLSSIPSQLKSIESPAEEVSSKMGLMGLNTTQARIAFIDLGRIVTGQGFSLRALASNFSLLGPGITIAAAAIYGLVELLGKQSDAEKKAAQDAQKLKETLIDMKTAAEVTQEAIGSEAGNIDRVQALAAVIINTNLAYSQRSTALKELQATNKSYFGDLTLEENSLKTLTARVNDYSQALITEAIIKGQVENIAKLSATYEDQVKALDKLKDARDRAQQAVNKAPQKPLTAGDVASGGNNAIDELYGNLNAANAAFLKQRNIVDQLGARLASYRGELNQAVNVQTTQKPLTIDKEAVEDANKIKSIYEQIARIYEELSKPSKDPLFRQNQNAQAGSPLVRAIQADIESAQQELQKAAGDPKLQSAYRDLISALSTKLSRTENPDLHAHFAFEKADIDDAEVKKFHDDAGKDLTDYMKKLPPLKSDIKVDLTFSQFEKFQQQFKADLDKAQDKLVKDVDNFSVVIGNAFLEDLGKSIGDAFTGHGLQSAFDSFMQFLGDSIIKIGEQLIVASGIFSVIDVALQSLLDNPALAAAAGVGAIAVGEAIKNSFHARPFAVGGIVTGPTFSMLGEAGPEVVFPLDRLNSFLKGGQGSGTQKVEVTGIIRGRDLAIIQSRDYKLQRLTS